MGRSLKELSGIQRWSYENIIKIKFIGKLVRMKLLWVVPSVELRY
jgi:hypothetical protein